MNRVTFKAWFFLFRPWSYTATLVPFLVAAGLFGSEAAHWGRWGLGLVCGLFFQATVNLLNTWGDERSGVDAVPGAVRTTPQVHEGLVSMRALFVAAACCAGASGLLGVGLCFFRADGAWQVDVPLLVAGFVGFLGSTNYSTGIKFKYRGLGVPFVAFLMGPLEIFVAAELLCPHTTFAALTADHADGAACGFALLSLPVAALVCVIMHGNDMRDIPTDRLAGISTPATLLGPRGALALYWFCHVLPYLVCARIVLTGRPAFLLPYLVLPLTARTLWKATVVYRSAPENPPWRGLERASGGIHCLFGVLYAAALAWFRTCT